jgi:hypothetical protein
MKEVADALARFRREPSSRGATTNPFVLVSNLSEPASPQEVQDAWNGQALPPDCKDLWMTCREARLFEDVGYGQWGMILLSPAASATRTLQERQARPDDLNSDDIVIGEFLGDQDLVILAPTDNGGSSVLIAHPLDPRDDLFAPAPDLPSFLERCFESAGEK